MSNKGDFLKSPAMRSFEAATGTRTTMPARSISTTGIPRTATTISASADPSFSLSSDRELAREELFILGRKSPVAKATKARPCAKPETAAGRTRAVAGCGTNSEFYQLTSLPSLFQCWNKARKNKSNTLRVLRFGADPLRHLVTIQHRLRDRNYSFGPYKTFIVREKKHRLVVCAPTKDRIVHWLLYQYMLPIWQPRFIHDTFGNLPGRGTHAAVQRMAQFARSPEAKWVLQIDISKYFYSVNHELLKKSVLRFIGDSDIRHLIIDLIDSFQTDSSFDDLFAADSMYRMTAAKGMPIGNLVSQLFANIILNGFDHWAKEVLRIKFYLRYVDDISALASSREELLAIQDLFVEYLANIGLTIHPFKIRLAPVAAGIPFLGYVVHKNHISAGSYVRSRHHYRLRQHEQQGFDNTEALASYQAMFSHTGSTIYKEKAIHV
jgi:RNA-directed DNA polymerase